MAASVRWFPGRRHSCICIDMPRMYEPSGKSNGVVTGSTVHHETG